MLPTFTANCLLQQSMPHKEYCIEVPSQYEGYVVNNNSRWAFVAEPSARPDPASKVGGCLLLTIVPPCVLQRALSPLADGPS